ncbi:hypothetical protein GC194_02045 [bacterium]|nr:hypothetical protein [bacterium]
MVLSAGKLTAQNRDSADVLAVFELLMDSTSAKNYLVNNLEVIGVTCGYDETVTENIKFMELILQNEKFYLIDSLMNSNIPETKYLAAITIELLAAKKIYGKSAAVEKAIDKLRISSEKILFCRGNMLLNRYRTDDIMDPQSLIYLQVKEALLKIVTDLEK